MINHYETLYICPGEISQEKVENTLEKIKAIITKAEGTISTAELWGKRRLAYPIQHNREGFYVYLIFKSPPTVPALLNHFYRVTDTVLRGLTVKVDPRHLDLIRPVLKAAEGVASASGEQGVALPSEGVSVPAVEQPVEKGSA